MIDIDKIMGRMGNKMFMLAFLYAWARDNGMPLVDDGLGYYYQDPKHWERHAEAIKNLFGANIVHNDYVGIHVRRGDYVNHPFYVDLMKTDYYQKAMAEFPGAEFRVYTDDTLFIRDISIFDDCKLYPVQHDELYDLNEMAGCKGLITANSSYSWWAGYLNKGKVVAPSAANWHPDRVERTKCPEHWVRI